MLFCKIKMTEIEEVIWRWILKTGFKTQTEISKNSYLTVNLLKGSRNQRISDACYGWESSTDFSLSVLLHPLAWKLGPGRVNHEGGTQDQLGAFPSQNGVFILAFVRAALRPFPLHYYHWSLFINTLEEFAFMPYCPLHGIRGYDL